MSDTARHDTTDDEGLAAELAAKRGRVYSLLDARGFDGVLVSAVRDVSWLTAGRVRTDIVLGEEAGVGSVLLMRDGRSVFLADNIEMPRFTDEELHELGFETATFPWHETGDGVANAARDFAGSGERLACDVPDAGFEFIDFAPLRYSLVDTEVERYRVLCRDAARAVEATAREITPGMTEHEIAAHAAAKLLSQQITPTVLLVGTDERIANYRHPLPSAKRLARYAMVVVCARRGGLVCAVTRLVHFGAASDEVSRKMHACARVNAHLQAASVPGARAGELLTVAAAGYEAAGFPGEWRHHHQGGAIGYKEREWVAKADGDEVIQPRQPFAWNPTVRGAKVEDTTLRAGDETEVLTATANFPRIEIELDGRRYSSADILVR